jgi:hypothetical protein
MTDWNYRIDGSGPARGAGVGCDAEPFVVGQTVYWLAATDLVCVRLYSAVVVDVRRTNGILGSGWNIQLDTGGVFYLHGGHNDTLRLFASIDAAFAHGLALIAEQRARIDRREASLRESYADFKEAQA